MNVSKGSIEIVLDSTVRKSLESELFGDSGCENLVSKNINFKLSYLLKWYCKFESGSDKIAFDTDIESPKCILLTSRYGAFGPVFFVGWNCARKTKFSDRKINRYVDKKIFTKNKILGQKIKLTRAALYHKLLVLK